MNGDGNGRAEVGAEIGKGGVARSRDDVDNGMRQQIGRESVVVLLLTPPIKASFVRHIPLLLLPPLSPSHRRPTSSTRVSATDAQFSDRVLTANNSVVLTSIALPIRTLTLLCPPFSLCSSLQTRSTSPSGHQNATLACLRLAALRRLSSTVPLLARPYPRSPTTLPC